MSAARRRHSGAGADRSLFVDVGFVLALAAVATYAAWPLYRTWYLFVTVGGALAIAAGIALVGRALGWSWLTAGLTLLASYVVLGVPLAVPRAFASRSAFVQGYRDLVAATVFGWKQLVTVPVPVGHYQALLVPMLITMLVCGAVAFWLVFARPRAYMMVVPVMLVPLAFAVAFGTSRVGGRLVLGGFPIAAPQNMIVGVLGLGLACGFLVWHGQHARTVALRRIASATGVRRAAGTATGTMRRALSAAVVVAVALLVAVPLSSTVLEPQKRQVLRTAIDPTQKLRSYVSPLTEYRAAFTPDEYDTTMFTVAGASAGLGRIRLATLSYYDGRQFSVLASDADRNSAFEHVPALTSRHGSGLTTATITIGAYRDPWMPTVAGLEAVGFHGDRANALTDGFYYNASLEAGAELAPLTRGDSYTVAARASAQATASLDEATAPSGSVPQTLDVPKSLTAWVASQGLGTDGASLAELIQRLRQRGYLSHDLVQPAASTAAVDDWFTALGEPQFVASLAGESLTRIDTMFTALTAAQTAAKGSTQQSRLVAAVGDDEQFAVASALIAESLGYPARVELGFRLSGGDSTTIPACDQGVCKGKNLTAWVEVKDQHGVWIPVDTTPQHTIPLAKSDQPDKTPQVPTQVQQSGAQVQPPPAANPNGNARPDDAQHAEDAAGAAAWLPAVRIGGSILLVLLVLAAPFVSLVVIKSARRRGRRRAATAAQRMAGGWDELVDTAVDFRLPAPGVRTRTEAASVYASAVRSADAAHLRTLASGADEAVFGAFDPTDETADQYWSELAEQRSRLAAGFPRWKRLRAAVSLRSFRTGSGGGA